MCTDKKELLNTWSEVAVQLAQLKKREMELRRQVQEVYFPTSTEGINKVMVDEGTLVYHAKLSRVVDQDKAKTAMKSHPAIKKFLRVSYNLDLPAYRESCGIEREILEEIITTNPLAPVLELKVK